MSNEPKCPLLCDECEMEWGGEYLSRCQKYMGLFCKDHKTCHTCEEDEAAEREQHQIATGDVPDYD
jgi:hypothetical protein